CWKVCRRPRAHAQEAEVFFQATFLVLAKRAGSVRWRASVAPWLHAVAQRLARRARSEAARRPRSASVEPRAPDPLEAMTARDLFAALDEELAALPQKYPGPLVLCCLEEQTQAQAARALGMSLSTVRRRLERGKALLQVRLTRRGVAPAALGALALAQPQASAVPPGALAGAVSGTAATARAAALAEVLLAG